ETNHFGTVAILVNRVNLLVGRYHCTNVIDHLLQLRSERVDRQLIAKDRQRRRLAQKEQADCWNQWPPPPHAPPISDTLQQKNCDQTDTGGIGAEIARE